MRDLIKTSTPWRPRPGRLLALALVLCAMGSPAHADSLWLGAAILLGLTLADRRSLRDTVRIAHARNATSPVQDWALRDAAPRTPPSSMRRDHGRRNELTGELADPVPRGWMGRKLARRARPLRKRRVEPAASRIALR